MDGIMSILVQSLLPVFQDLANLVFRSGDTVSLFIHPTPSCEKRNCIIIYKPNILVGVKTIFTHNGHMISIRLAGSGKHY